jgi:uncharacterized damage-inducible protein DinB
MTKAYFTEIARYNIWANNKIIYWIQQLSEAQWKTELTSSFPSVEATCLHIAGAEKIWLERWIGQKEIHFLTASFNGSKDDLISIWQKASNDITTFIVDLPEQDLSNRFGFTRLNGDAFTMQFYQSIAHVLNHSTYHRGQLITLLRQVGFTQVASTDLLNYFLESQSPENK